MESEDMATHARFDVVICLVQTPEQASGSTSIKKRRMSTSCDGMISNSDGMDNARGSARSVTLAKVKAKSSKLRECSTYFETCMSDRWAPQSTFSKSKFYLEVQTEVKYYIDCFSRMHFLCKPIASVKDCIELLKVASQIGFQALVDIGVKYLAAAPWSDDEETLIRDFCSSMQLLPCDSLSDLLIRLDDLPPGRHEKHEKLSSCAMNLLSLYLQEAISSDLFEINPESCKKFTVAFHLIVAGSESGLVCEKVLAHAMSLLTKESERLLSYLKTECGDNRFASPAAGNAVSSFCWLFKLARRCHAAQAIVELLLTYGDAFYDGPSPPSWIMKKWARMMYTVFEDVLEGKVFLKTSERVTLFFKGRWLMFDKFLNLGETQIAELVTRFVTTLPLQQQEECWKGTNHIDNDEGPSCEAHAMWISHMVTKKAQRQPELSASLETDGSRNQD